MEPCLVTDIEVLILAGGKGERLKSVVPDVPKPMAPIGDQPFVSFLLRKLISQGFCNFCFLTGYRADIIQSFFGDGSEFGVKIRYSHEREPMGTGGAIKMALRSSLFYEFVILNGDTFFNIDFTMLDLPQKDELCVALCDIDDAGRYGTAETDSAGKVLGFKEKSTKRASGFINAGAYRAHKSLLDFIPDGFQSFETVVIPTLVEQGLIISKKYSSEFIDIGIPDDFRRAQTLIPQLTKTIFPLSQQL